MSELSAERRTQLREAILSAVDSRLESSLRRELAAPALSRLTLQPGQTLVLAGHRTAGKTRLLPLVAELVERPGVDLDDELQRRAGRSLREWVAQAPDEFRAAEAQQFRELRPGGVVALGGGFVAHHAPLLTGAVAVLIPVSFETYRERLLADTSRPRLRPMLSLEEEISTIFHERERLHAKANLVPLIELLRTFAPLDRRKEP